MWPWVLPILVCNMEFLSQPDLMLYKFENNTLKAHARENDVFNNFLLGVELVKDAVCIFGKLC